MANSARLDFLEVVQDLERRFALKRAKAMGFTEKSGVRKMGKLFHKSEMHTTRIPRPLADSGIDSNGLKRKKAFELK